MFQCIECGSEISVLYRDFKTGTIKMSHCKSCKAVADKYVEYDPVIIILDALLLQPQAYRHLLINTKFESYWRLALLLWVCDAFTKTDVQQSVFSNTHSTTSAMHYSYLGLALYLNYLITTLELLALLICVLSVIALKCLWQERNLSSLNIELITKAIIVASVGHLLAVPAFLWGLPYSWIHVWLSRGFVCLSTFQALNVVCTSKHKTVWTGLAVGTGFTAKICISLMLHTWLEGIFS